MGFLYTGIMQRTYPSSNVRFHHHRLFLPRLRRLPVEFEKLPSSKPNWKVRPSCYLPQPHACPVTANSTGFSNLDLPVLIFSLLPTVGSDAVTASGIGQGRCTTQPCHNSGLFSPLTFAVYAVQTMAVPPNQKTTEHHVRSPRATFPFYEVARRYGLFGRGAEWSW